MLGRAGAEFSWKALLGTVVPTGLPDGRLTQVEVWRGELAQLAGLRDRVEILLDTLDPEEQRRAATFVRPEDREEYVLAHLVLRGLLGRRLGQDPAELGFRRAPCPACGEPHGRPELVGADPPLHFSLSHGAGLVLVALAERPVGIDVEAWPGPETVAAVSPTLPAPARSAVAAAPDGERSAAFAGAWTRLEAYLKGVGTGIAVELEAVDLPAAEAAGWVIEDLALGAGVAGAVALAPGGPARAGIYSTASRL